jgi:hypothetical protein
LVNRRNQEDFGEREPVHRILSDLEHGSRRSDSRFAHCTLRAKRTLALSVSFSSAPVIGVWHAAAR